MARLLFATGGTGGHIYPALAVAAAARARDHQASFLGAADGMEARLVPQADFAFHGVQAGKWDRQRPDPRAALRALAGLTQALVHVRRLRPDAVVGFGGFASFPGCVAATALGVPLLLHEGNAFPGRVVRWFAGRARAVATAQPEVAARLPGARRCVQVGFPVRETKLPRAEARRRLGLPTEGLVTLVMGGSQGSLALNRLLPAASRALRSRLAERTPGGVAEPHTVLHQTGERWLESVREEVAALGLPDYRLRPWVDATLAWSAADLAVTRAGISTIAEAAHHGVPLVLVPLPSAAEDHQRHNARAVTAAGAGRYVEQDDLDALVRAWLELLEPDARASAAAAARRRAAPGAADHMVDLIESELGRSHPALRGEAT